MEHRLAEQVQHDRENRSAGVERKEERDLAEVLDEQEALAEEEPEYGDLRELLRRAINQKREEGLERPELFVDKPVDPEEFVLKVRELIGE